MMAARVADFANRQAIRPGSMRVLAKMAEPRSRIRRKPRTEEQQRMLRKLALAAVNQRRDSGRLERVGAREYILHRAAAQRLDR